MSEKKATTKPLSATLTLTIPHGESESRSGTLLVQRGDLARIHQFTYTQIADLTEVIADALVAFAAVEAHPPIVPETQPLPKPQATKQVEAPQPPGEPTVDVPLKKGVKLT